MSRRMRVTSPQTRIALARRHRPGQPLLPLPAPADTASARAMFARQRRLAIRTMCRLGAVLFGLSGLIAAAPALDEVRLAGFPVSWLLVGFLVYPVLVVLAAAHVRAAEHAEDLGSTESTSGAVRRPGARS